MADLARLQALDGVAQPGRSGRPDGEHGVRLSTLDGEGLVALAPRRGRRDELAARLRTAFGVGLPDPGRATAGPDGVAVLWGGLGQYLVMLPADGLRAASRLAAVIGDAGAATALPGARTVIMVSGPDATEALSRLLPIDLDAQAFPPGSVAHTLAGHVSVLVWRREDDMVLGCNRSFGAELWHACIEAGCAFGVVT
ncbi:sarcosine oxidase subunit gamma [Elioraea sp.]|uniref:sarcosine oxidase subunit gamma n=1 Tax=Elioraea sp. TaxID=2185103 RepID=UPI003F72B1C3